METNEFKDLILESIKNNNKFANYECTIDESGDSPLLKIGRKVDNMSVDLYLEGLKKLYSNESDMSYILDCIIHTYEDQVATAKRYTTRLANLPYWNQMKDKVLPRLVNTENYKDRAAHWPHKDLDVGLTVAYYIPLSKNDTINVTNEIFEQWGITEGVLYSTALINLYSQEHKLIPIETEISSDLNKTDPDNIEIKAYDDDGNPTMFVLRNKSFANGAVQCLNPLIMNDIRNKIGDFYIIPSSIHETLIVPAVSEVNPTDLETMLLNTNQKMNKHEILLNQLMKWDGAKLQTV